MRLASADGRTAFSQQIQRVTVVIGAVLGLTLLITLSGLANTTDVSVLERTREIGILKALGATRRDILVQFLVSSVLLAYLPEKHRHAEEDDDETAEAAAA